MSAQKIVEFCLVLFFITCGIHRLLHRSTTVKGCGVAHISVRNFVKISLLYLSLSCLLPAIFIKLISSLSAAPSTGENEFIVSNFITQLIILITAWLACSISRLFAPEFEEYSNSPWDKISSIAYHFGITSAYVLASSVIWEQVLLFMRNEPKHQRVVEAFLQTKSTFHALILVLTVTLISPIVEEIFFRGFLYRFLKSKTIPLTANITSSLVFACVHANLYTFFPLFIFGICLTRNYERSGSLKDPILIHSLFNLTTVLMLLNQGPAA